MKFTLGKEERLKSRKLIEQLYQSGTSVKAFPMRLVFLQTVHPSSFPVQAGFSVPKRNFKKAVHRNRIKRLMRETYRLNKFLVYDRLEQPYVFMISYIGKEEIPYDLLDQKMKDLLQKFLNKTAEGCE